MRFSIIIFQPFSGGAHIYIKDPDRAGQGTSERLLDVILRFPFGIKVPFPVIFDIHISNG